MIEIKNSKQEKNVKLAGFKGIDWHRWSLDKVRQEFPDTDIDVGQMRSSKGLSSSRVLEIRKKSGLNILTQQKEPSRLFLYLKQYVDTLMILIEVAAILSLISYLIDIEATINLVLSVILFGIVVVLCTISFFQELETQKVIQAFKSIMPSQCMVIRDGHQLQIQVEDLVPGDLVLLHYGQKIPADLRLLQVSNLKVECASITGESEPIKCTIEQVKDENFPANEATNLVFSSTSCIEGTGIGVVMRIGDQTIIGQIAEQINNSAPTQSRLQIEMQKFVNFVAILSIVASLIILGVGIIRLEEKSGQKIVSQFVNGFLVIIVAFVPQGLPPCVLSLLTVVGKKLAHQNIFVKRLDIIETLGSTSLIASDKTGTLTKNQMSVQDVWSQKNYQTLDQAPTADQINVGQGPLSRVIRAGIVCNSSKIIASEENQLNARFFRSQSQQSGELASQDREAIIQMRKVKAQKLKIEGNASDIAILRFCEGFISTSRLRQALPKVFEIPFSSTTKS